MTNHMDRWLGGESHTPLEPKRKDTDPKDELIELLTNWLLVVLMDGKVMDGKKSEVFENIKKRAAAAGLEIWEVEWIKRTINKDKSLKK